MTEPREVRRILQPPVLRVEQRAKRRHGRLQEQQKAQVEVKVEIQEEVKVEVEVEIQERTQASTRVRIRAGTPPEVLPGIRGTFRQAFRGELGS